MVVLQEVNRIHRLGIMNVWTFFFANPFGRCSENSQNKWKNWPADGIRGKVLVSPKTKGFILWTPNFMSVYSNVKKCQTHFDTRGQVIGTNKLEGFILRGDWQSDHHSSGWDKIQPLRFLIGLSIIHLSKYTARNHKHYQMQGLKISKQEDFKSLNW